MIDYFMIIPEFESIFPSEFLLTSSSSVRDLKDSSTRDIKFPFGFLAFMLYNICFKLSLISPVDNLFPVVVVKYR